MATTIAAAAAAVVVAAAAAANGTATVAIDAAAAARQPLWAAVLIVVACSVIMTGTVVGNTLVCIAVSIVRKLRTPSNWLIVSLAVADLLVALLVMPLAVVYEIEGQWLLGQGLCDMWTSCDVMLCTASILNLCMISVDRYFVISQPFAYAVKRTPTMMAGMIMAVWLLSAIITIPPMFGWKGVSRENECQLSQEIGYQIYATIGAFYLPLVVMMIIYYRIYTLSARIHRAELRSKPSADNLIVRRNASVLPRSSSSTSSSTERHGQSSSSFAGGHATRLEVIGENGKTGLGRAGDGRQKDSSGPPPSPLSRNVSFLRRSTIHRSTSVSKDRKATKTLGVIMGAFIACWLPFFIVALIRPFLPDSAVMPRWIDSLLQWLGFANSFFNPIIYARFNRDFRTPFKEILFFRCVDINLRVRSESYTEQYGGDGAVSTGALGGGHRGTTVVRNRSGSFGENSVFVDDGKERVSGCLKPTENNGQCNRSVSVRKSVKVCY